MRSTAIMLMAIGVAALSGCGNRTALEPPPGQALPKPLYGEKQVTDTNQLLEASTQARPVRSDEILRSSEKRQEDKFDLPPDE